MAKAATKAKAKAKHLPGERDVLSRQRDLERTADIGGDGYDGSHVARVCYNRACPDYRRARRGNEACGCKQARIPTRG